MKQTQVANMKCVTTAVANAAKLSKECTFLFNDPEAFDGDGLLLLSYSSS
jgi:hypothetical protein